MKKRQFTIGEQQLGSKRENRTSRGLGWVEVKQGDTSDRGIISYPALHLVGAHIIAGIHNTDIFMALTCLFLIAASPLPTPLVLSLLILIYIYNINYYYITQRFKLFIAPAHIIDAYVINPE